MAIPKIIWQTYKTDYDSIPIKAKTYAIKWQILNPSYEYNYFTDEDIYKFIEEYYGQEMLELAKSFKVPVMLSDLWRILVIYQFGGIYADIDTEPTDPLDNWLDLSKNFVVAIENGLHYVQWAFMAEPKSPIVKSILDTVLERCKEIDYTKKEFIHYYTGPNVFTEGIRKYFKLSDISHSCKKMEFEKNCFCDILQNEALGYENSQKMIDSGFFCFSGKDWDIFRTGKIHHHFGSYFWKNTDYDSWLENELAKKSREVNE
jgi:mannosyltransferase OCH1-like enzyme